MENEVKNGSKSKAAQLKRRIVSEIDFLADSTAIQSILTRHPTQVVGSYGRCVPNPCGLATERCRMCKRYVTHAARESSDS